MVNEIREVLIRMHIKRAIAGTTLVMVSMIAMAATGQDEHSAGQADEQTSLANCKTAMPVIMKQYDNARYALQAARNSGDRGHILDQVNLAQAALDAMEQPLNVCSEALQNLETGQSPADHAKLNQ